MHGIIQREKQKKYENFREKAEIFLQDQCPAFYILDQNTAWEKQVKLIF